MYNLGLTLSLINANRARDYNIVIFSLEQVRNLSKELSERIK